MDNEEVVEVEMPILLPMQNSPDIVNGPPPQNRPNDRISETQCERAVFIWELHDKAFPVSVIPPKLIVNPNEPDRDSSTSILDVMGNVPSGRFVRGQEVSKPTEWQLYLQKSDHTNAAEVELQLALKCERIFIQESVQTLAKVACEIIDSQGVVLWSSGDVYDNEVKPFSQGTVHIISLGKKLDLQNNRAQLIKQGIIRFRLKLNIYKKLTPTCSDQGRNNSENWELPAKRRRLDAGLSSGMSNVLCSLKNLWTSRQESGDITIRCGGHDIKAHRFLLSGQSEVFMKMLDSEMNTVEKSSGIIEVPDVTPEIVTAMLEFLYLDDTGSFEWSNVAQVCRLIYAANKYFITPLKTKCYQNLMTAMNLDTFAKIAEVTFKFDCEKQFKDEVRHFYESNQITLNDVESFRQFARENFDDFYKLFFYIL